MIKRATQIKYILVLGIFILIIFLGLKYFPTTNFYLQQSIEICRDKKDQVCYKDLIMDKFKKQGLDSALMMVTKIYAKDQSFSTSCHDIGHLLGSETYKLFKAGKPFTVSPEIAFCSYGFYHGFMDLMAGEGDVSKARDFCKYVDTQMSKITPDASLQCFHGIGHGWVNIHGDKSLVGDDLGIAKRGLTLCEKVSTNDSELSRCATGVFNGVAIFYGTNEYNLKIRQDDPMWICRFVDSKFQDPCYISMNTVLYSVSGQNLKLAAHYIEQIKDDTIATHAMINLALPFSFAQTNSSDYNNSIGICRGLQKRLVAPCLQGFAFGILEHGEPGKEYIKSLAFCKNNWLTKDEEKQCLSYIYLYLPQWYPKDKAYSICQGEGEYNALCAKEVEKGIQGLMNQ